MKHKLMRAMGAARPKPKLEGRVEVDDAYLGGERPAASAAGVLGSSLVPRSRPRPSASQRLRLSVVKGFRKKEIERLAKAIWHRQRDRQRRSVLLARGREGWLLASPDVTARQAAARWTPFRW